MLKKYFSVMWTKIISFWFCVSIVSSINEFLLLIEEEACYGTYLYVWDIDFRVSVARDSQEPISLQE